MANDSDECLPKIKVPGYKLICGIWSVSLFFQQIRKWHFGKFTCLIRGYLHFQFTIFIWNDLISLYLAKNNSSLINYLGYAKNSEMLHNPFIYNPQNIPFERNWKWRPLSRDKNRWILSVHEVFSLLCQEEIYYYSLIISNYVTADCSGIVYISSNFHWSYNYNLNSVQFARVSIISWYFWLF